MSKPPLENVYDEALGIWKPRLIYINPITNVDHDMQNTFYGSCALVPLVESAGADVCLWGLGYKLSLPVGAFAPLP